MSMREERRVVTAVFADLVGSTALGERLDPEELKLVVGEAVSRMVVAVEAFDGHVKDLAGDGVLAIFGAPTSHEDDAERAVRAGMRIVEEIAAFGREIERSWGVAEVDVRVGIDTGPVVTGAIGGGSRVEYSALGDAVNTASRLQGAAVPGTVLVGAETHRAVAESFAWGPVRELTLKGKGSPVEAYPVAGVAGASPGPSRGRRVPMIGREAELALADSLVEGVVLGGSGAILYLSGEPGIGKTRMMQELRELVRGAQPAHGRSLWLEGRCVSYGESMSYWPFRDLLRSWLGVAPDDPDLRVTIALRRAVDRLFGARAGELTPYLGALLELSFGPDADAKLAELSPEAAQFRTFEVVRHLIQRLAEDGPVVMAFEDLHWADATSLLLLEQLFADTEALPLLIVCTGRPERDHPSWRLKDETARTMPHRFREIALESLSGDSGSELLAALVGHGTLPAATAERVLASADGNPFFLEEIVRSLQDAGALVPTEEGLRFDHEVDVEIPPTVEKVILARIDRLEPSPRQALLAASVLGRRFSLSLLEAVADDSGIRSALSELQRLDFVREGRRWPEPEFRFKHALIQEAAYRTLVTEDRTGCTARRPRPWRPSAARVRGRSRGCWPTTGSAPPTRTRPSATSPWRATVPVRSTRSTRRSPTTGSCCRCWSGAVRSRRSRSGCSSWRSPCTWRCGSRKPTRPTSGPSSMDPAGAGRGERHPADRQQLPAQRPGPAFGDRLAEHPTVHAVVRPARRAVAGAHDRAVARGTLGHLRRRPPLRVPSSGRLALVRRHAPHGR